MPVKTTTHIEADVIARSVQQGDYDDRLDELHAAIQERRQSLSRLRAFELKRGDTIHFSDQTRPRYLVGLEAMVVKVNRESINVDVPDSPEYQRFAGTHNMRVPNNLIAEIAV